MSSHLKQHVIKEEGGRGVGQLANMAALRFDVLFRDAFHDVLYALQRVAAHAHQCRDALA